MAQQALLKDVDFRATQNYASRVIRLAGDYRDTITETIATLKAHQIEIVEFHEDDGARRYVLNATVVDALCTAWTAFKADKAAYDTAKQAHEEATQQEALAIAATCDAIVVEGNQGWWVVTIPALDWGNPHYSVRSADQLFARVKQAINRLREEIIAVKDWTPMQWERVNTDWAATRQALLARYAALAEQDELQIEVDEEDHPF